MLGNAEIVKFVTVLRAGLPGLTGMGWGAEAPRSK